MLKVRKTTLADLDRIDDIFDVAKAFMRANDNMKQWSGNYPNSLNIKEDIEKNYSYVVVDDNDRVVGTFAFIIGIEETYLNIYEGKWLNDEPYGTIHRIASDNMTHGVFECALNFCKTFDVDIRIDTHKDNKPMIHLINKHGFIYCGIIYVRDKSERLAYQLCRKC